MDRLRLRILAPLVATAVVFVLAGCTPPHPHGSAHSPSGSPSPSATPAATRPALSDLLLSTEGLGPLHLGAPVPATPAPLAIVSWDPVKCVSVESGIVAGGPNAGAWSTTFPDVANQTGPGTQPPFVLTTVGATQTGNIDLVWVWGGGVHTAAGIRVGSTLAELHTAYPAFSRTITGILSDVYVMDAASGSLSFEVSKQETEDGANYWPDDQVGHVLWMGATAPGTRLYPIAATDGGPSPCPSLD